MIKESTGVDEPEPEPISLEESTHIQQVEIESLKTPSKPPVGGVSISEPDSRKPLPVQYVEGKGKVIIVEEQTSDTLLKISSPTSKSAASQYILKRRSPEPSITPASPDKALSHSPNLESQAESSATESNKQMKWKKLLILSRHSILRCQRACQRP